MELLRTVIQWINRRPILSAFLGVGLVALTLLARLVISRSDGTLTEPIRRGEIVDAVYGIGTVTATRSYSIKPGVIQSITGIFVKEGDSVRKGAKLLTIDSVTYRAPFDGTVNYLPFKVGENVFTQLPALVLTDLSDRYLVVTLEQQGALKVKPGQRALLSFDSIRQQNYEGVVKSVYSYNSGFLARIDLAGLPAEILPEMTADVAIIVREAKDVLLIPTVALDNGKVWVKRARSLPTNVPVELGIIDSTAAEVISGKIQPGDRLMIRKKLGS